jgi:hypothetical protein
MIGRAVDKHHKNGGFCGPSFYDPMVVRFVQPIIQYPKVNATECSYSMLKEINEAERYWLVHF